MFQQSRVIGELTWENFKCLYADSISVNSSATTLAFGGSNNNAIVDSSLDNVIHDSLFELNNYHFHRDLWKAANDDPLTTIYSAVWTLCYTLPPPHSVVAKSTLAVKTDGNNNNNNNNVLDRSPTSQSSSPSSSTAKKMNDFDAGENSGGGALSQIEAIEYYTNWYPLILLHKYLCKLYRRSSHVAENDRSGQTTDFARTSGLFTMEQIHKIDQQYLVSFDKYREATQERARQIFEEDEETFLRSKLFTDQTLRTPYGSVERSGLHEVSYSPLSAMLERSRLTNLFKRTEYVEPLRQKCEQMLVRLFGLQVRVNSWLLPMLRRNEDTAMFGRKLYEEKERLAWEQMVMYWQFQKSEILWFVLHTLFALNDLVADDALTLDLLYFVSDHLERFVECGLCREHWIANGKKLWKMYMERYGFSEKVWRTHQHHEVSRMENSKQMEAIARQLQFTRVQTLLDTSLVAPDLFMLHTHNEIQTQNIANTKRLTDAALQSLRVDYRLYAFLLESCVRLDDGSLRDRRARVDAIADQRTDVLRQNCDVFASVMLRDLVSGQNDEDVRQAVHDPATSTRNLRQVELLREKLAYYNLFNGGPAIR